MDYREAVDQLSPEIVQGLRRAVETGRWPDGSPVTEGQRRESLQAVIAWEAVHLPETERVGYLDRRGKDRGPRAESTPLRWADKPGDAGS